MIRMIWAIAYFKFSKDGIDCLAIRRLDSGEYQDTEIKKNVRKGGTI
jgi:hypothetical protein